MLTQDELKKQLHYDIETGLFTRLVSNTNTVKVGEIAGTTHNGYIKISLFHVPYAAHRLAWFYVTGEFPKEDIDHINGIKDDNRWCNLRLVTMQQNQFNRTINKNNKSGYKGVHWDKLNNNWRARACINYKGIHIGCFKTREEAAKAYNEFSKKHHGQYSRPNIIQ